MSNTNIWNEPGKTKVSKFSGLSFFSKQMCKNYNTPKMTEKIPWLQRKSVPGFPWVRQCPLQKGCDIQCLRTSFGGREPPLTSECMTITWGTGYQDSHWWERLLRLRQMAWATFAHVYIPKWYNQPEVEQRQLAFYHGDLDTQKTQRTFLRSLSYRSLVSTITTLTSFQLC